MSTKDVKFYIGTKRKDSRKLIIVENTKTNLVYEFDVFKDQALDYQSVVDWWKDDDTINYFASDIKSILRFSTVEELKPE